MTTYVGLQPNQRRMIRCFEICGSITKAARWAKLSRQMHYDWCEESEEYRNAFEKARSRALTVLEDECIRRAHDGVRKAVYYKGKVVGYQSEYSDQLLIVALKAWGPDRYRDRSSVELTGKDGKPLFDVASIRAYMQQAPEDGE